MNDETYVGYDAEPAFAEPIPVPTSAGEWLEWFAKLEMAPGECGTLPFVKPLVAELESLRLYKMDNPECGGRPPAVGIGAHSSSFGFLTLSWREMDIAARKYAAYVASPEAGYKLLSFYDWFRTSQPVEARITSGIC